MLLIWFQGEPLYIDDERSYNGIAVSLATEGKFATPSGTLTSIRPPLYPALVAVTYRIFGIENFQAVRVLQALLSLASVVQINLLARKMYSPQVGLWAAGICCFYPPLVFTTCLLLTETLFIFLLLGGCLALFSFLETSRLRHLLLVGVAFGLAALTRSVLWLFPPFLVCYLLYVSRGEPWSRRIVLAAIPVIAFGVVLAPWSIRNTRLQRTFTTVDVMGGRNVMMGNYEYTPLFRAWDAITIRGDKSWHAVLAAELPEFGAFTQGQRDKAAMRRGVKFAATHPGLTLQRSVVKFFNFWQLDRAIVAGALRGYWGVKSRFATALIAALVFTSYAAVVLGGIYGFVLFPPQDRRMHWFLLLLVGFICAIHSAVFAHSRYHLPVIPLVMIYAAAAANRWRELLTCRDRGRCRFATVVSAVLIASWILQITVIDLGDYRKQDARLNVVDRTLLGRTANADYHEALATAYATSCCETERAVAASHRQNIETTGL